MVGIYAYYNDEHDNYLPSLGKSMEDQWVQLYQSLNTWIFRVARKNAIPQ